MLRTQRQQQQEEEEEVEEEGDIFIFHHCTAVRGGPHQAHQTLLERENTQLNQSIGATTAYQTSLEGHITEHIMILQSKKIIEGET